MLVKSAEQAAEELLADARGGRLDGDAVDAVVRAAGHEIAASATAGRFATKHGPLRFGSDARGAAPVDVAAPPAQ